MLIHTASSRHFILLVGGTISAVLPGAWYRKLVSFYEGRKEEDLFPTRYCANTGKPMMRLAESVGLQWVNMTCLKAPPSLPTILGWFESLITRIMPPAMSNTLLFELRKP